MSRSVLVGKILKKVPSATKSWADSEGCGGGYVLVLRDEEPPYASYVDHRTVIDGMESMAEMCLKHEDADFRKVAREISREQWGKIKITNKIVSAIVQHGAFGEEIH